VEYKDFANRQVKVGDFIAYATKRYSSAFLRFGYVRRLKSYRKTLWKKVGDGYESYVIDEPSLGIYSVDTSWRDSKMAILNKGREVTLSDLDKVVVVAESSVPEEVKQVIFEKIAQPA
jgi:hypothetical protein